MMMRATLAPRPIHLRLCGWVNARSEWELANGIAGIAMGLTVLLQPGLLASLKALSILLNYGPEWAWGTVWIVSGVISVAAAHWGLAGRQCALLWWFAGWSFLGWQAVRATDGWTLGGALYGACAAGTAITYVRLMSAHRGR